MDEQTFIETVMPDVIEANKEELYVDIVLDQLRWDIYEHLVSRESEEEFLDITKYIDKLGDVEAFDSIFECLRLMGWKVDFSFGNTGVFIYLGDKPKSCW